MSFKPNIDIIYEDGWYTATITRKNNSIVTEGKTLDELLAMIDDAFKCHFHTEKEMYHVDLSIPAIRFVFDHSSHATLA